MWRNLILSSFILTNLNQLYLRTLWAIFGWKLPRSSWIVIKNAKTLQRQGRQIVIRRATDKTWNSIVLSSKGEYLSHADVIYLNRPRRTGSLGVNVWSSQDINVIVEKKKRQCRLNMNKTIILQRKTQHEMSRSRKWFQTDFWC